MRSSLVLVAAAAVLATSPPSAFGSIVFVHHEFPGAIYGASGGEANELTVSETAGTVTFIDPGAVISAESPCVEVTNHKATCPGVNSVVALLEDRGDSASVQKQDEVSISLQGGGGSDHLTLCAACGGDLNGEAGNDILQGGNQGSVLRGGPGLDTLRGGGARDFVYGDAGADLIAGRAGGDLIGGGTGRDRLRGNRGKDRLRAKDGFRDLVGGGRGLDRARVDGTDVVRRVEKLL
jgi:Ca2+-binding RTX toxin-like protein